MQYKTIEIQIPVTMEAYIVDETEDAVMQRNALLLYP